MIININLVHVITILENNGYYACIVWNTKVIKTYVQLQQSIEYSVNPKMALHRSNSEFFLNQLAYVRCVFNFQDIQIGQIYVTWTN